MKSIVKPCVNVFSMKITTTENMMTCENVTIFYISNRPGDKRVNPMYMYIVY